MRLALYNGAMTVSITAAKPRLSFELALLVALATVWGASYTFIKIGVATIPPVTLIAARTLIAGLVLLAVIRWRGLKLPRDARTWLSNAARFAARAWWS